MFDKRTAKLLSVLTKICTDGSYKIIEIGDLVKEMLPRFRVAADELGQMVRFLADNEMIDVKYSDEKVYCMSVLPKGRVNDEEARSSRKGQRQRLSHMTIFYLVCGCFLAGFAGAFLGALFAGMI